MSHLMSSASHFRKFLFKMVRSYSIFLQYDLCWGYNPERATLKLNVQSTGATIEALVPGVKVNLVWLMLAKLWLLVREPSFANY